VYSLIEGVIEHSQNQPFKDVLYQNLFTPLGMKRVTVGFSDFNNQNNKAWPHQLNQKDMIYPSKNYSHLYHAAVASAAGVNASITDMIPFLRLQLVGDPNLVSISDLTAYHSPVTEAKDASTWFKDRMKGNLKSSYGFGWRIIENSQQRIVFHGGWVKGFKNFLAFLPDKKIGIVILHNAENSFSSRTAIQFLNEWVR
jgi:beta-lactamase class C